MSMNVGGFRGFLRSCFGFIALSYVFLGAGERVNGDLEIESEASVFEFKLQYARPVTGGVANFSGTL